MKANRKNNGLNGIYALSFYYSDDINETRDIIYLNRKSKLCPKQIQPGKNTPESDQPYIDHDRSSVVDSFASKSIDAICLRNNDGLVASAAKEFKVSTILTTVSEKTFSGPIFGEIKEIFPQEEIFDRTTMNAWEDNRITDKINKVGKYKIVFLRFVD